MASQVAQGAHYLPVLAVWMALVGALLNRNGRAVLAPLIAGAIVGGVMVVAQLHWLLWPVVGLWALGLMMMALARGDQN